MSLNNATSVFKGPKLNDDGAITWPRVLEGLFYTLITPLLLCKPKSRSSGQNPLSTSSMRDEDIADLTISSEKVDANTYYIPELGKNNFGIVARIAPDAVAKCMICDAELELLSAELVRTATAIPVPLCDRLVRSNYGMWLVQEFIPGRTLDDAWPVLGWWQRLRIMLTLRYYIYELRSLSTRVGTPPFPGPPAVDGAPQRCTGRLFNSAGSGPFHSYRELARWYQNRLLVMQKYRKEGLDAAPFDCSEPLVFTHLDLHPRNVILGDDGQLWVIDWGDAGWYPSWFEAASMQLFAKSRPDSMQWWAAWTPFVAGSCESPGQLPFIRAIAYSLEVLHADIMNLIDNEE